jgi:hypothetical protein
VDITPDSGLGLVPPCADPRFDHRTCDYWEDADRGSRAARSSWLTVVAPPAAPVPRAASDNPFAPPPRDAAWNPFATASSGGGSLPALSDDDDATSATANPFAPGPAPERPRSAGLPRKLALLDRGRTVFGSYAKVLLSGDAPVAWAQFGPLSAYPRAAHLRELYPQLPDSPLPAVITCIATTGDARGQGHAARLVGAVCDDLAGRGFAAGRGLPGPHRTCRCDERGAARVLGALRLPA